MTKVDELYAEINKCKLEPNFWVWGLAIKSPYRYILEGIDQLHKSGSKEEKEAAVYLHYLAMEYVRHRGKETDMAVTLNREIKPFLQSG